MRYYCKHEFLIRYSAVVFKDDKYQRNQRMAKFISTPIEHGTEGTEEIAWSNFIEKVYGVCDNRWKEISKHPSKL